MKSVFKRILSLLLTALLLTSCSTDLFSPFLSTTDNTDSQTEYAVSTDRTLAAKNYYEYVNQGWLESTADPSYSPVTSAFSETTSSNLLAVYQTFENNIITNEYTLDTNEGKLTKFYMSAKDISGREEAGNAPLKPYLSLLENATTLTELQDAAAQLDLAQLGNFVSFGVLPDSKDRTVNRLQIAGPVLGFSDKSYYDTSSTATDLETNQKMIAAYKECLVSLFVQNGWSEEEAEQQVEAGYAIEEQLVASTLSTEDAQNAAYTYNRYKLSTLSSRMSNFDIARFLEQVGLPNPAVIIVKEYDYYMKLDELFTMDNFEGLRAYLYMTTLFQSANLLTPEMATTLETFDNTLNGTSGYSDAKNQAMTLCRLYMGEEVGELYVNHYFSEETKENVTQMVDSILSVYKKRLGNIEWLSQNTKNSAIEKLDNMSIKVGYPDQWTDLSNLTISSFEEGGSLFQNVVNLYQHDYAAYCATLDQPVNRTNWGGLSAFDTNAYYKNSANEIVIPAGILKEPFYSSSYSVSQNYGGIGSIIAHEISHAFDDDGRKYDQNGTLSDWWTAQDLANYNELTSALVAQYDAYEVYPGYFVNGSLTLNENIADLGGISCITELIGELPDGQGNYEEMFSSYATAFREKVVETYGKRRLVEDVHAPSICRVNVVLSNIDKYYEVYSVGEGEFMYRSPEERIQIW